MDKDPFKEYIKQSEPNKRDKGYAWHTAIGLQAVDGLKTSKYLIDTAIKNIEGDISIDEAQELLNTYYEENPTNTYIGFVTWLHCGFCCLVLDFARCRRIYNRKTAFGEMPRAVSFVRCKRQLYERL